MKTNVPGLIKDSSGMVTNQNLGEYELIKKHRADARANADTVRRIELLEKRMDELSSILREIR